MRRLLDPKIGIVNELGVLHCYCPNVVAKNGVSTSGAEALIECGPYRSAERLALSEAEGRCATQNPSFSSVLNGVQSGLDLLFPGRPAGFSCVRSRKVPRIPVANLTLDSPNLSRKRSAAASASFQRR
jgi:hypothetical protein